jgi:metal-sulfur cluster biosynthetic enzyme
MDNATLELKVYNLLKKVLDPEININIIDLGLVYSIEVEDFNILIEMTFSSKNCPLSDSILMEIKKTIGIQLPTYDIKINIVWDPEWNAECISEDGLKMLNE